MNSIYKSSIAMILAVAACLNNVSLKSQTYYSRFASPAPSTHYSYAFGGVCIGCYLANPANAGTMSMTDSSRIYMTAGVLNSTAFRLKLTDTADQKAGVVVSNNTGLLNLSALGALTLKTYYAGSLQETFSGGSLLNLSLLAGSKQRIEATVTKKFNEVQFEVSNALSVLWDINMFYAFGTSSGVAPLPVSLVSFNVLSLKNNKVGLDWQVSDETGNKGYHVFYSNDGLSYSKLDYIPVSGQNSALKRYTYEQMLVSGASGAHYYYIATEDMEGNLTRHEVKSLKQNPAGGVSFNLYPNPVLDRLNIDAKDAVHSVTVYDYVGQAIFTGYSMDKNQVIDFEKYLPGHYLISVQYEDGSRETKSFVKS